MKLCGISVQIHGHCYKHSYTRKQEIKEFKEIYWKSTQLYCVELHWEIFLLEMKEFVYIIYSSLHLRLKKILANVATPYVKG